MQTACGQWARTSGQTAHMQTSTDMESLQGAMSSPLLHMLKQPLIRRISDPLHSRLVSEEASHYRI